MVVSVNLLPGTDTEEWSGHVHGSGRPLPRGSAAFTLGPACSVEVSLARRCLLGPTFAHFPGTGTGSQAPREVAPEGDAVASTCGPLSCPCFPSDEGFEAQPLGDSLTLQSLRWDTCKQMPTFQVALNVKFPWSGCA